METASLYLNGTWVKTDTALEVANPASGQVFAQMATCTCQQVHQALHDARQAWRAWRELTGQGRGRFLNKIADELETRQDEIARTITLENGKPLAQSLGEVGMTMDHFRWFAEEAKRAYGRTVPNQVIGKRHIIVKSPVGVVGAIAPWNFPLVLAARKIAPALAAGCPVILKPASYTPLCSVYLAECVHAAGVPKGVFQLVCGSATEIGAELLENPICRKITFTGSTEVGKKLIAGAAHTVTKLSLELGGNAPAIVFDDADPIQALEGVMVAKFRNTAQSCIAANRIYVQKGCYQQFCNDLVEKTKALKVDDGLVEGVDIGPLIDENAVAQSLQFIDDALSKGAKLLCGGKRLERDNGYFLQPTVLADVPEQACGMQDEIFAPVALVSSFASEQEVIERANDTPYGLAAYCFTRDLNKAFRLMDALEAGTLGINDGAPSTSQCPFGGLKESGWGRELGAEGLDAFLETKHVSLGGIDSPK